MKVETIIEVSIHARHCWRANVAQRLHRSQVALFQSTPAIAGRRMNQVGDIGAGEPLVSIHARHCWRANEALSTASLSTV